MSATRTVSRWLLPVATLSLLLATWELVGSMGVRTATSTPLPTEVLSSLASDPGFYLHHAGITFLEASLGLMLGIVIAVVVASCFALSGTTRAALMPLVIASQTVPLVAVGPVLAQLIGEGLPSRIAVTAWLCWFPAVVSTTRGMLDVDPGLLRFFRSAGARRLDVFLKLRLPSSIPSLVSGVRAAAGFALIGAIVVEYAGAKDGLGAFIMAQTVARTDSVRLFGVVVVSALAGVLLTESSHRLVRRALQKYLPASGE